MVDSDSTGTVTEALVVAIRTTVNKHTWSSFLRTIRKVPEFSVPAARVKGPVRYGEVAREEVLEPLLKSPPNKEISSTLNIFGSTVHVSNILHYYGVHRRADLICSRQRKRHRSLGLSVLLAEFSDVGRWAALLFWGERCEF